MSISNQRSRLGHIKPDGAMVCHGDGKSLPVRPGSALAPPDRGPDAPTDWIDNSPALPLLHSHEHSLHSQEITRWSGSLGDAPGDHDPLLEQAVALLPVDEPFPVSFLQRRFRIGHSQALQLHGAVTRQRPLPPVLSPDKWG